MYIINKEIKRHISCFENKTPFVMIKLKDNSFQILQRFQRKLQLWETTIEKEKQKCLFEINTIVIII